MKTAEVSLVIAGITRNGARTLARDLAVLRRACDGLGSVQALLVESDSDDDTLDDGDEDANGNGVVDDGETDPRDPDTDDDGVCDAPALEIPGICAPGGADADGDGVGDLVDNCPDDENGDQEDADDDGLGDACDDDDDGDGYADRLSVAGGGLTSCASTSPTSLPGLALGALLLLGRRRRR